MVRRGPEHVETARSRVAPEAHYAKAFVHCLSFPSHCAFLQLHAVRILARSRSRHPPARCRVFSAFFFFRPASRSPLFSFSFLFLFFTSLPRYVRRLPSHTHVNHLFPLSFFFPFQILRKKVWIGGHASLLSSPRFAPRCFLPVFPPIHRCALNQYRKPTIGYYNNP